jgi:hypothetical protein
MNHKKVTLGIAAIMTTVTAMAIGFAVPQQALAYHHHQNHDSGIKVDQQITQVNDCNGTNTTCFNQGQNQADIDK